MAAKDKEKNSIAADHARLRLLLKGNIIRRVGLKLRFTRQVGCQASRYHSVSDLSYRLENNYVVRIAGQDQNRATVNQVCRLVLAAGKGVYVMKLRTMWVAVAAVVGTLIAAQLSPAAIQGSAHDFSLTSWSTNSYGTNSTARKEICRPCHVPHKALSTSIPLWNHSDTTNTTYTLYNSATLNATNTIGQPTGVSKACLSCHDGSTALDSFGGASGSTFISSSNRVGYLGSLQKDHPIAFEYTAGLASADTELEDPTAKSTGLGGTIATDMLFDNGSGQKTRLECASCHDVHNTKSAANSKLLLIANNSSALCLMCHKK